MIVHEERPGSAERVRALVVACHGSTGLAEALERLRDAGDLAVSMVVSERGRLLGHAALSRLRAPHGALALAPVSVDPDRLGEGIASRLIRASLVQAQARGWRIAFASGNPAFFARFGFTAVAAAGYVFPGVTTSLVALPLVPMADGCGCRIDPGEAFSAAVAGLD